MTKFFDLFAPPEGYTGDFGWICGFTADARVMREIADRFTVGAGGFLATHRRPALYLVTDPASAQITAEDALGVHHMTLAASWKERFRGRGIFHAKVALLRFVEEAPTRPTARRNILRLIVSTGNWTTETLERNIDLFWQTELKFADPGSILKTETDQQALADILQAYAMFESLRPHLSPNPWAEHNENSFSEAPHTGLHRLLAGVNAPALQPVFFHSLEGPLRQPLLKRFGKPTPPGILLFGSGFYAGGDPAPQGISQLEGAEAFLSKIADDLTEKRGKHPVCLVLNPNACQGLAEAAMSLKERNWKFFAPRFPDEHTNSQGKLHAKFIYRGHAEKLDGLLYIGSGNLTPAGLGKKITSGLWNFEAGVVIAVNDKGSPDKHLPFNAEAPLDPKPSDFLAGTPFRLNDEFDGMCPVSHFLLHEAETEVWLEPHPPQPASAQISTRHSGGDWQALGARIVLNPAAGPPMLVWVRSPHGDGSRSGVTVPVLSESGALVLPELHRRRLEDVLDALILVDETGREADLGGDEGNEDLGGYSASTGAAALSASIYSTRRLMAVITTLGEGQAELRPDQSRLWAARLVEHARCLARTESEVLSRLRKMCLNPFRHLGRAEFMPLGLNEKESAALEASHMEAATLWGVETFEGFDGDTP